jgi:hypothetical protein
LEQQQQQRQKNDYSGKSAAYFQQPTKNENAYLPKSIGGQYNTQGRGVGTTTKRNVIDAEFEPNSDDSFDDAFEFSFAKTIVPTKGSLRTYDTPPTLHLQDPVSVTTFRPSSARNPDPVTRRSKAVETPPVEDQEQNGSQPHIFLQAPAEIPIATTQAPLTFGKKIKSGRKRNTSNWTSYFNKN